MFAAFVRGEADRSIEISGNTNAAIAYSPATGKYGIAYDLRSRSSAEKAALEKCGAEDACIACWVNKGFCALALGSDKSCWGVGWSYGGGASTSKAKDAALDDCRQRNDQRAYRSVPELGWAGGLGAIEKYDDHHSRWRSDSSLRRKDPSFWRKNPTLRRTYPSSGQRWFVSVQNGGRPKQKVTVRKLESRR